MPAASGSFYFLTSLLPFVLVFGVWMFAIRNVRTRVPAQQQPLVDKLEEIRAELERLRKSVEDHEPAEQRFGFRS
ncbi:MAG: hypothetical protein WAQ33_12610 [Gaiellaceae bacterium]